MTLVAPTTGAVLSPATPVTGIAERAGKLLDLTVLKKGAEDFLSFVDSTKETFYAYLYHRLGSAKEAQALMAEIYLEALSSAMSLLWFGTLSLDFLLTLADRTIANMRSAETDIDRVYLPTLESWLTIQEISSMGTLHDAVWTLPAPERRLIILSVLVGMPNDRLATAMNIPPTEIEPRLVKAREMLLEVWRPAESLKTKLTSLVYVPALDINRETALRVVVVEKYNALKLRRYQWVVVGGLLAVFSNLIVASVLAFAVVTEPPTTLRSSRMQTAALDAVLLERQGENLRMKQALASALTEAHGIVAHNVARELTLTGLSAARDTFENQAQTEADVDSVIDLLKRAQISATPLLQQFAAAIHSLLTFNW